MEVQEDVCCPFVAVEVVEVTGRRGKHVIVGVRGGCGGGVGDGDGKAQREREREREIVREQADFFFSSYLLCLWRW